MTDFSKVPGSHRMQEGVRRYIEEGGHVGDFLTAIIENDLKEAVVRADKNNLYLLKKWVLFLIWEFPADSWGSKEKRIAWQKNQRKRWEKSEELLNEVAGNP